eukprot:scaffold12703_cov101-Isochrysis_galbana.AAC.4
MEPHPRTAAAACEWPIAGTLELLPPREPRAAPGSASPSCPIEASLSLQSLLPWSPLSLSSPSSSSAAPSSSLPSGWAYAMSAAKVGVSGGGKREVGSKGQAGWSVHGVIQPADWPQAVAHATKATRECRTSPSPPLPTCLPLHKTRGHPRSRKPPSPTHFCRCGLTSGAYCGRSGMAATRADARVGADPGAVESASLSLAFFSAGSCLRCSCTRVVMPSEASIA